LPWPKKFISQSISASGRSQRQEIALDDSLASLGLSAYDRQRLKQDILQGRTQRDMVVGMPLAETSLLPGQSLADSVVMRPTLAPEYTAIIDSLRARAADRLPDRLGGGELVHALDIRARTRAFVGARRAGLTSTDRARRGTNGLSQLNWKTKSCGSQVVRFRFYPAVYSLCMCTHPGELGELAGGHTRGAAGTKELVRVAGGRASGSG